MATQTKSLPIRKKKTTKKNTPALKPKKKLVGTDIGNVLIDRPSSKVGSTKMPLMNFKAPDGREIHVSYELISPEYASELLELNTRNRTLDERLVKNFTKKQKKKHWMFNGDTIRISEKVKQEDGSMKEVLMDGQHRLQSIVESGIPQFALIIRGLDEKTFSTMDDGRKRNASDILSIKKFTEPTKKAGIVKTVLLFSNGYLRSTKGGGDRSATPGNLEILEFTTEHNTKIDESIKIANEVKESFNYLNSKVLSSMFFIFSKHGKAEAKEFFEEIKLGKKSTSSVVRLFCAELIKDANRDVKLPYNTILAYLIKTWNAFKSGEELEKLTYDKKTESFPIPQ